ncbi:MAG: ATP-binding protein [Lachnospiraceae bacterium]|nr:ATP-binding protein [Lachnospiraceae bacterium]
MSTELTANKQKDIAAIFKEDTRKLGELTAEFIQNFYPAYNTDNKTAVRSPQENSLELLNSFTFYRIVECKVYDVEDKFVYFAEKLQKLFTTAYSIKRTVCYGIVSSEGKASLLLGVAPNSNDAAIFKIIEGLLPGIKLEKYTQNFVNEKDSKNVDKDRYVGCISGIPALKINGEYQNKDLSSLMRSLNGQNYTIMVLCKPISEEHIQNKIDKAIQIQDECFVISKRTLSIQKGDSKGNTHAEIHNEAHGENTNQNMGLNVQGALPLTAAGAVVGSIVPGIGTVAGAIGGGLIGLIVGKQLSFNLGKTKGTNHTISEGYSDAVTTTISDSKTISGDIQNGFAIELMNMAESMIERLKIGRNIGMWESVVTYSSDSKLASDIIQGSLYSEIASGIPEVLPPVVFSYKDSCNDDDIMTDNTYNQQLMIPKGFFDNPKMDDSLCSFVTSEEICGICSIPVDNTVGFEIQESRGYALNYVSQPEDKAVGYVCEYDRPLLNIPFGLSEYDLNKHTFVCGLTGSGKTNTVKKILEMNDKPFLVIEPAKKEYRNINKESINVYTLGRPELNCIKINPFYVLPGISPQQHIDLLKDLFSASFAFYGPMPYILEKCLYNIYEKKGWNLTLGFHPCLINSGNPQNFFNEEKIKEMYAVSTHKYLFPTMQDLKDEIDYYINNEMTYEGEVKGNIQSAMKARIDSLCVGSKGYMYNTHENIDYDTMFNNNSVLELEGLADDSDKAFTLGLLIIYLNEFRQVQKEVDDSEDLKHLLVIEEAHRLLQNVSTEDNVDLGNPKGKAVEHFTNMLAEMRSYGQGVIVAEQIPSKLAPDVIKNSSNKIIHRIIAKDDQEIIANTIGVYPEDAIYLGNSKAGYALCHKEGMVQPVIVKVDSVKKDIKITDTNLYDRDLNKKLISINESIIKNQMSKELYVQAVKSLITIMYKPYYKELYNGLELASEKIEDKAYVNAMPMVPGIRKKDCILNCIAETVIDLLISGVFSNHKLPDDELVTLIHDTIKNPTKDKLDKLQEELKNFYGKQPENKAIETVAGLIYGNDFKDFDVSNDIKDYTLIKNNQFVKAVKAYSEDKRKGK